MGLLGDHHCGRTYEETVISAIRNTLTATAAVTLVLATAAACGTVENLTAGQKLDRAFDKLGKEHSLFIELDLDTDAASLKALDAGSAPEDKLPAGMAELFTDGRVSFSLHSRKPLTESGEKDITAAAVKITGPQGAQAEYRMVGDTTYYRADLESFGKLMGSPMPSPADLPPGAEALEGALKGEWVKVSMKDLEKFTEQFDEPAGAGAPKPEKLDDVLDAKTQKKIVGALKDTIAREVDFRTEDGKDGAERVTATASLRTLVTAMIGELRPLAAQLPPGVELPTAKDLKQVPDRKAAASFTLRNGELTEVSVDIAKLAKKDGVKKFGLVLRMGEAPKVKAPAGATELNLDELMGGLFGGAPGGSFESSPMEDPGFEPTPQP
ncbi:hypothetical protein [Streptomyces sp. CAU 1734]|uniref:hypothetical protein n=1 Tax=Streptomyces sp. CAU 1734 TaxID=3140360 RepID=UPI003260AFF7